MVEVLGDIQSTAELILYYKKNFLGLDVFILFSFCHNGSIKRHISPLIFFLEFLSFRNLQMYLVYLFFNRNVIIFIFKVFQSKLKIKNAHFRPSYVQTHSSYFLKIGLTLFIFDMIFYQLK